MYLQAFAKIETAERIKVCDVKGQQHLSFAQSVSHFVKNNNFFCFIYLIFLLSEFLKQKITRQ